MDILLRPFRGPSRTGSEWFSVGVESSFPEVGLDLEFDANQEPHEIENESRLCGSRGNHGDEAKPGCKIFHVPRTDTSQRTELEIPDESAQDLTDQVLVFKYRGKFHAVDHQCPHSSFPLSQGTPFDIEDFGIVLSAGLTCPKHNWSFDLFSGRSDRGNYKLKVWEVELRDSVGTQAGEKEVWVRRKPRMG